MISEERLRKLCAPITVPHTILRNEYLEKILPWVESKEIIILKGIRRCGKTHLMHQIIQTLPDKNVFYVNFEEFQFDHYLSVALLEAIVSLRNPDTKAYFVFDEIQRIPGFEKWLRTYYDKEYPIKFIIGGSNISLLTPELATVLTGRNITFTIKPLNWTEYQQFGGEKFSEYLRYGGFPEVVLEADEHKKVQRLQQYVTDIISKDILFRKNVENPRQIRDLAIFLLSHPGVQISANKLGKQIGISKNTAQKYLEHIKDTYLIFEVPFFSQSAKTKYIRNRASKYYVVDNGLVTVTSDKDNIGALYENLVATHLQMYEPRYWQNSVEIDFVYEKTAIQVTATTNIPDREKNAFKAFEKSHKKYSHILITPTPTSESIGIQEFLANQEVV